MSGIPFQVKKKKRFINLKADIIAFKIKLGRPVQLETDYSQDPIFKMNPITL